MIRHDAAPPTSAGPPYYGYGYGMAHDEPVDARTLTKIVRRHRLLIGGTIVAITGMATLLAFNLTPQYTGVASVTIDPQATRVVNTEAILEERPQDRWTMETHLTLIKSRSFARRLVEQHNLLADPEFNPALRPPEEPGVIAQQVQRLTKWLSNSVLSTTGLAMPSPTEAAAPATRRAGDHGRRDQPRAGSPRRGAGRQVLRDLDRVHLDGSGEGGADGEPHRQAVRRGAAESQAGCGGARRGMAERPADRAARQAPGIRERHRGVQGRQRADRQPGRDPGFGAAHRLAQPADRGARPAGGQGKQARGVAPGAQSGRRVRVGERDHLVAGDRPPQELADGTGAPGGPAEAGVRATASQDRRAQRREAEAGRQDLQRGPKHHRRLRKRGLVPAQPGAHAAGEPRTRPRRASPSASAPKSIWPSCSATPSPTASCTRRSSTATRSSPSSARPSRLAPR